MAALAPMTDGVVTIRSPESGDSRLLVAGRDEEFHRYLDDGATDPDPTACIVVGGEVVGWVDYDTDRTWLLPGEVNIGYNVFAAHRGNGYATRAVELLMRHLAIATAFTTGTLLINPANLRSLAVAARAGFVAAGDLDGSAYFTRVVETGRAQPPM